MPKHGCVNIHASLLPKYRGAGPIQWAIIDGEKKTGVTIMQMEKGLDTGDMLLQKEVEIDPKETGDSLHDKLAAAGAELIVEALPKIAAGQLTPRKQNDAESCYAKMLQKSMGRIDWNMTADKLDCLIRGLISVSISESLPGTIVCVEKEAFYVQTKEGVLKVLSVQIEGKKRMAVKDFLLGYPIKAGECLGS